MVSHWQHSDAMGRFGVSAIAIFGFRRIFSLALIDCTAAGTDRGGGEGRNNHPPISQLPPSRYSSRKRCKGPITPRRMTDSRPKSIGVKNHPSIPICSSSPRYRSKSEADTAKMGIRTPLSKWASRSDLGSLVASSCWIRWVASKPL